MANMTRDAWRRRRDLDLRSKIRRYGFTTVHVGGECGVPGCDCAEEPVMQQFGYTIGLTERGHPELLVSGVTSETSHPILNHLAHNIVDHGERLCAGERIDLATFGVASVFRVVDSALQLVVANEFYRAPYGPPVPALGLLIAGDDRYN